MDPAALQEALADRFYALEIRDCTRMAEDVWRRAEEDSLRGLFLRELREKLTGADEAPAKAHYPGRPLWPGGLDHRTLDKACFPRLKSDWEDPSAGGVLFLRWEIGCLVHNDLTDPPP